jgi:hypothetical protein
VLARIAADGGKTINSMPGVRHMQLTDLLAQMGGLQSMARELGVSENQAASGAEALLPAILGGLKKQAQAQPTGVEGLGDLLGGLLGGQAAGGGLTGGSPGLGSLLDLNGDGNPLDDITAMAGRAIR